MKGSDLHPKDHSIQLFTDTSNKGSGAHLHKWSVVRRGKKVTHKCSRAEGGFAGPSKIQGPVSKPNSAGAMDNSTVVAYINKQGGTHSVEMCALLWKIMTWCHHYKITLKARHIPGCLNVMADLLSRSNQVQSTNAVTASTGVQTDLSQVVHSCRSICHSSEPQTATVRVSSPRPECLGHRCSKHKLVGSHSLCLSSNGSPSQGDRKDQTM